MAAFEWGEFGRTAMRFILRSTARINIAEGSVRSGKTVASIVRWIEYVKHAPPGDLLMVGKTERTLKRNVLDVLEQMVGRKNFRYNRGLGELMLFGRRVYIAGANDERAAGKIQGLTLAGAYGDELTLWPESFFTMLLSRLSVKGAKLFGTTNPDFPSHWLKVHYLDRATYLGLFVLHFSIDDNPNLDAAYVASLKREYTGVWYQRYILGLWVAAEGAIYRDAWSDDLLFDEESPDYDPEIRNKRGLRRYIAVDYGTLNPQVYLDVIDDGRVLWAINQYYWDGRARGREKTDGEYAEDLEAFIAEAGPQAIPVSAIIVDPSAASFRTELRQRRLRYRETPETVNADNDVLDGIRMVATMLKTHRLRIHRNRCRKLHEELIGYVWDERAVERGMKERPVKIADHSCDCVRYLVNTLITPRRLAG